MAVTARAIGAAVAQRRLALLCQHFFPEMISTGMHATELAVALRRIGWDVTVYCAQPTLDLATSGQRRVPAKMDHEGVHVERVAAIGTHAEGLSRRLLFASTYLLFSFLAVLRNRDRFDGLLVTTNPPFIGIAARLASLLSGKPFVLLVYDVYPDTAVGLGVLKPTSIVTLVWEHVSRWMLNGADAVVVIGRDMADVVRAKLKRKNQDKLHLIPNWSDERVVSPVPKEGNAFWSEHGVNGRALVQYSGRMGSTHNLEPLIDAAEHMRDDPVIFQFIGDGAKKKRLEQLAAQKRLDNVQFLPYQPLERLGEVLSAADLAVVCLGFQFTGLSVPSKTYGIMASGTPILGLLDPASEIGRTILENDCGIVYEDPTGEQVAEAIRTLTDDPVRLSTMGANGRRAFLANYTLSLAAERYSVLLARCLYGPLATNQR